jgi:hypothetical protein
MVFTEKEEHDLASIEKLCEHGNECTYEEAMRCDCNALLDS